MNTEDLTLGFMVTMGDVRVWCRTKEDMEWWLAIFKFRQI